MQFQKWNMSCQKSSKQKRMQIFIDNHQKEITLEQWKTICNDVISSTDLIDQKEAKEPYNYDESDIEEIKEILNDFNEPNRQTNDVKINSKEKLEPTKCKFKDKISELLKIWETPSKSTKRNKDNKKSNIESLSTNDESSKNCLKKGKQQLYSEEIKASICKRTFLKSDYKLKKDIKEKLRMPQSTKRVMDDLKRTIFGTKSILSNQKSQMQTLENTFMQIKSSPKSSMKYRKLLYPFAYF